MTLAEDQPILFTMRIKTAQWENLKRANDEVFGELLDDSERRDSIHQYSLFKWRKAESLNI